MNTIVSIKQGKLKGTIENDILAFYNIPYGKLTGRFNSLAQSDKWEGIRDATNPGPILPQIPNHLAPVMGELKEESNQNESAISANIWTSNPHAKRPVVIWIHGGGFKTGGGSLPWYNGNSLAKTGDIVTVTINYRLGAFGHLYIPGQVESNLGLRDLKHAFKWVMDNISNFGGDPSNISLAGQSAGASYVLYLAQQKDVAPHIKNVCLFSPPNRSPLNKNDAYELSKMFLTVSNNEDLNNMSVESILNYQVEAEQKIEEKLGRKIQFAPVQDDVLLHENVLDKFVELMDGKVNVLLGATEEESAAFFRSLSHKENYDAIVKKESYEAFHKIAIQLANKLSETKSNVYYYRFKYRSENKAFLSCHCFDLPFLFGNFDKWKNSPMLQGINKKTALKVSTQFQSKVLNFIKNGHPNDEYEIDWERYTVANRYTYYFE